MIDSDDDEDLTSMIPKTFELEKNNNLKIKVSYDQNPLNCWKANEKNIFN